MLSIINNAKGRFFFFIYNTAFSTERIIANRTPRKTMDWCLHHTNRRVTFLMLFVTVIQPCLGANLLDPKRFSQTLTDLAIEGLGTSNLQVRKFINSDLKYMIEILVWSGVTF